jgi:hypothetical protein
MCLFSGYLKSTGVDTSNGTMFRLQLRDECMARDSKLSDQTVTLETIDRILARF